MTADLADRMIRDLSARLVLVGYPERRADLVETALAHWGDPACTVTVTDAGWRLVVAMIDRRYAAAPEIGGGVLVAALRSPAAWADCEVSATLAAPIESAMPSHANAGPPPAGPCIHGIDGARPCGECEGAARRRMREAYAAPRFAPTARVAPRSPAKPGSILRPYRPLTDEDVIKGLRGGGA